MRRGRSPSRSDLGRPRMFQVWDNPERTATRNGHSVWDGENGIRIVRLTVLQRSEGTLLCQERSRVLSGESGVSVGRSRPSLR